MAMAATFWPNQLSKCLDYFSFVFQLISCLLTFSFPKSKKSFWLPEQIGMKIYPNKSQNYIVLITIKIYPSIPRWLAGLGWAGIRVRSRYIRSSTCADVATEHVPCLHACPFWLLAWFLLFCSICCQNQFHCFFTSPQADHEKSHKAPD